jgi:hypothetical protein
VATGYPTRHRRKVSREPLSLFPDTPRLCIKCDRWLPPAAFNRDSNVRDGLSIRCRECRALQQKSAYPTEARAFALRHVRRTYGLEPEQFEAMVRAQTNRCAICSEDMGQGKGRHVDHCHVTGKVRALLCNHCNSALGHAKDNPMTLRAMADYVERHKVTDA